jgi:hypothetical protein
MPRRVLIRRVKPVGNHLSAKPRFKVAHAHLPPAYGGGSTSQPLLRVIISEVQLENHLTLRDVHERFVRQQFAILFMVVTHGEVSQHVIERHFLVDRPHHSSPRPLTHIN